MYKIHISLKTSKARIRRTTRIVLSNLKRMVWSMFIFLPLCTVSLPFLVWFVVSCSDGLTGDNRLFVTGTNLFLRKVVVGLVITLSHALFSQKRCFENFLFTSAAMVFVRRFVITNKNIVILHCFDDVPHVAVVFPFAEASLTCICIVYLCV